ncbi:MAG: hypothetical protein ABMA64_14855 [Myxococcota bacterium]
MACSAVGALPGADADLAEWDRKTAALAVRCPEASLVRWYRANLLFRIGQPDGAIDELDAALRGDQQWPPEVAQQAQYVVAVRMAARAGLRLSAPPERVGPSETALRQVMEIPGVTGGFAGTAPGDLATVNQMFGWWQSSVNDITAIALGGSGGGTMWIPGFDASSGYSPQPPAWGTVVAPAPSTERPDFDEMGALGNGIVENRSSEPVLVLRTDNASPVPLTHLLPSCTHTPRNVDFDGVRAQPGATIDGHTGWWKLRDVSTASISGSGTALSISCFTCNRTNPEHDAKWAWDRAQPGGAMEMPPIDGCRPGVATMGPGMITSVFTADDGCNTALTCADCTRRECGWCGSAGKCMPGTLAASPGCSSGWQPTPASCADPCVSFATCGACTQLECGWCAANQTCAAGTLQRPAYMDCDRWQPTVQDCR